MEHREMSKEELVAACKSMGAKSSGTKEQLIARLEGRPEIIHVPIKRKRSQISAESVSTDTSSSSSLSSSSSSSSFSSSIPSSSSNKKNKADVSPDDVRHGKGDKM